MTGNDILNHAGKVSHAKALQKAHTEYEKYKEQQQDELSKAEKDFVKSIEQTHKKLKKKK